MDYFVVYPVLTSVPLWLICVTVNQVRKHRHDGFDRPIRKPKHYYVKRISTALMFLITMIHIGEVVALRIQGDMPMNGALFIGLYLGVSAVAWLVSFFMLRFEFRLKLPMRWAGHRGFWVVSSLLYLAVMIGFFFGQDDDSELFFVTYLLGCLISLSLAFFAVFRPNEFPIEQQYSIHALPLNETPLLAESTQLQVFIRDFKTKVEGNKSLLLFNLLVQVDRQSYRVRRSYLDFDSLHRAIRQHFPGETFPYLTFPEFPMFTRQESVERRMKELETYLANLLREPAFLCEELIQFLEVREPLSSDLLETHRELIERTKHFSAPDSNIINLRGTYALGYQDPENESLPSIAEQQEYFSPSLQSFVGVQLSVASVPDTDFSKLVYEVQWTVVDSPHSGSAQRSYKQFKKLHSRLKKVLHPAKLPSFPSKNYLQTFLHIDRPAVDRQREELERYMANLLNDPAYHCPELLGFICCSLTVPKLWGTGQNACTYLIAGEVTWDTEAEGESFYQVYTFPLLKLLKGNRVCEWVFSRRFSEFYKLHNLLVKRAPSRPLAEYLYKCNVRRSSILEMAALPEFPSRSMLPLVNHVQIEERKEKLEKYFNDLLRLPAVRTCYYFRVFIREPVNSSHAFE